MQIVIEISDEDYEYAKEYTYGTCGVLAIHNTSRILRAIADGKTLPKGHGRLVDENDLSLMTIHLIDGVFICDAPAIIEADRSEK